MENQSLINAKTKKEGAVKIKHFNNLCEGLYDLFYLILQDPIENFWWEVMSLIFSYFQMIIYVIDETVSKILFNKSNINI